MVAAERELTLSQRSARRFVNRPRIYLDIFERAREVMRFKDVLPADEMRRTGLSESVAKHTMNCRWRAAMLPVGERTWAIIDK